MLTASPSLSVHADHHRDWLETQTRALLALDDLGHSGRCDYDTAWVARVPDNSGAAPSFPNVAASLRHCQREDGGFSDPGHIGARAIATLAAVLAMTDFDPLPGDTARVDAALDFLHAHWGAACAHPEPTIAFELLAPALLAEAIGRGLPLSPLRQHSDGLDASRRPRVLPFVYAPGASVGFSLEFMGDALDPTRAKASLANDTVSGAVSATAYYVRQTGDARSHAYLDTVVERFGPDIPYGADARNWGTIWSLHHLRLAGLVDAETPGVRGHLDHLRAALGPQGLGWSSTVPYGDGDDTSLGLHVLASFGDTDLPWDTLAQYEQPEFFVTHLGERAPSPSVNAHVLTAATAHREQLGPGAASKAAGFLRATQHAEGFWKDKWHASPLYPTSRAVLALLREDARAVGRALQWIASTQRSDGSWGHVVGGTPEETAYAVLALAAAHEAGLNDYAAAIGRACQYLVAHDSDVRDGRHARLWMGKDLYCPTVVVRSAVLAALSIGARIGARWEVADD